MSTDTIAAIATPPGQGGVGIIRVSGPGARAILGEVFSSPHPSFTDFKPYRLHHGQVTDASGAVLDEVLAVFMPGPSSYTGEDIAEINCHGGPAILEAVLETVLGLGARLAEPGEFTKRAFLNGRLDLTQAEAVAEVISAPGKAGLRFAQSRLSGLLADRIGGIRRELEELRQQLCLAVDFPEEDVEVLGPEEFAGKVASVAARIQALLIGYERSRCWREGGLVVLAGRVNAGKSSLLNALLGRKRAIVSDVPGTTRDFLEESVLLRGLPVRLADTAGLRETGDIVELEGVRFSNDLAEQADLVLLVVDGSRPGDPLGGHEKKLVERVGPGRILTVLNKRDKASPQALDAANKQLAGLGLEAVSISAARGEGIDELAEHIRARIVGQGGEPDGGELVPNLRQSTILKETRLELDELERDIRQGAKHPDNIAYDLLGVRLETACAKLSEITGEIVTNDILRTIFDHFCIGK